MGKIWINTKFRRDHECTNIKAARGDRPEGQNWKEGTEKDLIGLERLWIVGNTQFYGYL